MDQLNNWHGNKRDKINSIDSAIQHRSISICTYAMNRFEHVKAQIPHLLSILNKEDEIVLVDYGASIDVKNYIAEQKDSRIKLVTVNKVKCFHLSHARNIACVNANTDVLIICDIDLLLSKSIIDSCRRIKRNELIRFETKGRSGISGISGTCCVNKSDFNRVNGYEEAITGWGFEELAFYETLHELGISDRYLQSNDFRTLDGNTRTFNADINIWTENEINKSIFNCLKQKSRT